MALSPQLQQFKSSGVYRLEFDKSQTVNIPTETIRLIVGRSKKGPYNTPVLIENTEQFVQIFGGIDNSLERKGMFFHRSALEALSRGPILAMNITTKDANDLISGFSPVTAGALSNATATLLEDQFSKAFDTGKFWTPENGKVLTLANNTNANSNRAISFVNIKQDPITIIIRQALNTDGFNVTAREFFGEGEVPEGIDNLEFVSDYMVDVLVFKGKFDSTELNNDPTYGTLFTDAGLRKEALDRFVSLREVEILAQYTGSLIPEFKDNEGRQLYIETIINREARRTGLFVAVNEDAIKNIDLIGNGFDIYAEDDFELLSHVVTAGVGDEPNTRAVLFPDSTWTFENKGAGVFTMAKTVANSALEPYFNPDYTAIGDEEMHIKVGMSVQTGGDQDELARIKQIRKLTPNVGSGVGSDTFTEGVDATGEPGESVAQTVFTVPVDAPDDLQYYCTNHPAAMGSDLAITSTKETFTVTTISNPDYNASGSIYKIGDDNKPELNLKRGGVYTFDQSNTTNDNHPIAFKDGAGNTFTDGVVVTGTPGQTDAKTVFTVPLDAPDDLRYYCTVHGDGMGNTITVEDNESKTFEVTVVNDGNANVYRIDGVNKPVLNLVRGGVYTFNQSDVSNAGHPLRIRNDDGSSFTEGVDATGEPGESVAQTVFTVPVDAPDSLQYYCTNHPLAMGNDLAITSIEETFTVTTISNPDGSEGAIYQIGGDNKPELNLVRGGVYTFDQSHPSNTNHPLLIRDAGDNPFTDGVVVTGTPGQPGAKTVFTVPLDAPYDLRYYCTAHGNGMGNTITVEYNESKTFEVTVVNVGGINIYQIDGVNKPVLNLVRGGVYTFDQSDTTNETHPLRFRLGVGTTYTFEFVCHRNVEEAPEYALKTFKDASNVYKMFPINGALQNEKRISELLTILRPGNGLSNTLVDKDAIDFRYVIDTFGSLEADTILNKGEIAELCKERQNASAILNAPMVKELKASTNPSFMNEFTGEFETRFVGTGGNINLNPTALYTLPSINEGANYAFYYGPGLNVLENGRTKVIPPAAYVSNNYIDKYSDSLPWSIVAGPRRGVVGGTGVQGVEFAFDKNDRDVLEPFGYNPIVFERGVGIVIKGNKTAQQSVQSALSSAHVREAMIFIEDGLAAILQNYLFEFNNAQTRLEIQTLADNFMESVKKDGGVFDFRNIMDTTNNTNEIIDNNIGILDTFVEPVKGLEILVSRVTILNTGEIATGNFA